MWNEVLFVLTAFLSNTVQAITGFAGTALAMPVSIRLVGYDVARPILNVLPILVSLFIVIANFRKIRWKRLLFLFALVGSGFAAGLFVQSLAIDQKILLRIYGVVICVTALLFLFFPKWKIPKPLHPVLLVLAGILHFLYTSGGPLVVLYASSAIEDKDEFRCTLSCLWLVLNSIIFVGNVAQGAFTTHVWILTAILSVAVGISVLIGRLIAKKLNREMFLRISYILLFISGLFAII